MKRKLLTALIVLLLAGCGTSVATHTAATPAPTLGGAHCGRERWDVKTATDPAAQNINLTPQQSTVAALGFPYTSTNPGNPDQPRDSGSESTVYTVHATLVAAKLEADSDFHLVLQDGVATMIAEIPDAPACTEPPVTAQNSVLEPQIEAARAAFIQDFGQPTPDAWLQINQPVTVTGVGFFDVPHGQRGIAPNAIELHPVINISTP